MRQLTKVGPWAFVLAACGSTPIDPPPTGAHPPSSPPSPAPGTEPAPAPAPAPNPAPAPAPAPDPAPAPEPAPSPAPPLCVCPASPIATAPLQTILLDGSRSYDPAGGVLVCGWSAVARPQGSTARLEYGNTARASFFVDLAGDYKLRLNCKTQAQVECSCATDVHALPDAKLTIQVTWDTPTVDVDIHMLRTPDSAWFSADDVFFGNRGPNWAGRLTCSLDLDDTDGYGPELISCRPRASGDPQTYKLGVHYYSDDSVGPTRATLRIYCMGTLAAEAGPVLLQRTNDFWDVGSVTWPGCQVSITDPPPVTAKSPGNPLFP
ncbi:MAG: hypothetical protein HYY84_14875 [Deltaproteobacteria bacterium]|nr:hypothetical protein [Deltaproteobacteria bacterium]